MALRIQKAEEGYWLYQNRENDERYFTDFVILGKHEPEWAQCTQAEREAWEEEHKPEPPTPEPQTEE